MSSETQRPPQSGTRGSRREVLAGLAAGIGGLAGCTSLLVSEGAGQPVSMLVAGSLANPMENGLRPALDRPLRVEAHGSAHGARLVASGKRDPDIVSLADTVLFSAPMSADWYAKFATNAVVLAYDPETPGGARIERRAPDRWYDPLLSGDVRFGRTDPDLDPLGYRTLFVFKLASDHYGVAVDLRKAIPRRGQIYPETRLASAFETGGVEAAMVYRSTAIEREYEFISFPPAIDLSDPAFAERYATVSYDLPGGKTVEGAPIAYGATLRTTDGAPRAVFERHVTGDYLAAFGFGVPDAYPRYVGDVPDGVR
ncbi:MAG: extracellular solute-binding protein [Halobacteriales archaeon]